MKRGERLDNYNEDNDFYVVNYWSEKPNPNFRFNSSVGNNILSRGNKLSRRNPTEGEIDEFLENLKQSNSKCGTSGLEGSICNSFNNGNGSGNLIKIPEGSSRDKLCVINQTAKESSEPVKRFKHSIVSYKPGETLTETFFSETSVNDLSRSINNNQEIGIPSSDSLFHVSFDRNEDCRGGFSDIKGSQCTNGPSESTTMESSSHQLRRARSRSPYASSTNRYPPVRENIRFPTWEDGRNHSHLDNLRSDRSVIQDRKHHDDMRRHRLSRSRSRERKHHRRRSHERRSSFSISPPSQRESGNQRQRSMEPGQLPLYSSNSGASMPPNSSFMNPNPNLGLSTHGPVQYPINPVTSGTSYERYPGYNVPANNLFNSSHTQAHTFQPQMPQNQYPEPQNYHVYNQVMQGNPPNPVPQPASWNQSSAGFNQNYSVPNVSTDAVMYPHLKIGQSRIDSFRNSHRESLEGSSPHKQSKNSFEKGIHATSPSPDRKKHKRKTSKKRSESPSLDRKYEDSDKRYIRHNKSPVKTFRYDSKKPKVIIDPNRIPTPPPPPIVGSYKKDESKKSIEQKVKNFDGKSNVNPVADFLNKEKVSLSCLLEAVMETSGQGKSRLSDPKVKKEIISNCESKIQHLYKRRMTGLGAFIPDPVHSSLVIDHLSPLVAVYSPFTYNCEEENNEWHCPGIIVPEVKMKKKLKVPLNNFTTSRLPFKAAGSHLKTNIEHATVIPTLSDSQLSELNWNASKPEHVSQHVFPNAYGNNQPNMFPSHQGPQPWSNPVNPQNPYSVPPSMPGSANEYSTLGPSPYIPPSYPFPHRPPGPQFMSQHSYPPQPEMLNYPTRMDYPPMHHFQSQNLNHPGMFSAPQPDSTNRSNYQYKADETHKLRKNKNMVNDNLILLSHNSTSHVAQKDKKGRNHNSVPEDTFRDDRDKMPTDNPKDKLLRKVWRLRKSSEYDHVIDVQGTKEPKDEFYSKLNYAEMKEDTVIDTIHDYQLANLRERIETCLAEGKSSPGHSQHRSRDRVEGDRERDRHKDRDRGRDRPRESERFRRGSKEGERKWHGRSPLGDERKKRRSVEGRANYEHSRKSKEPSDKKDHCKISSREDVIEILSDDDHSKHKLSESSTNEKLMDPDDHLKPSEKTLLSSIFDLLGPEIRKIQEKSDLYKSIIDSLEKGDKAYKRIYSFRNHALMKYDKDNRMKMVIPRDSLKEVVTLIHKSFHHVQSEELSRLLKNISYPYMLYIPKCVSKVMSECPMCVEEKKKNDDPLMDKKSETTERKPGKRNNKSLKERDRVKRNSAERLKRMSKDKSSSSLSKRRRDHLKSGRGRDKKDSGANDGRPSGYEKATNVRKPGVSPNVKSKKITPDNQCLEKKSNLQIDVKASELLHGLSDKALEFKHISDPLTDVSEDKSSIPEGFNEQSLSDLDKKDYESTSPCCEEISKNDSEDKGHDPIIVSSDLVTKPEMESSNTVIRTEMESCNTVTKPEMESSNTVTKPEMVSPNTVTKSEMESSNTVTKTEMESSNTVTKPEMESSNTVTKTGMESSDQVANSQNGRESANSISESSGSVIVDLIDKNEKPNESSSDTGLEVNNQSNRLGEESKENNFKEEKALLDQKVDDVNSKTAPKLDFKGRVREVQISSNECKNIMKALELGDETNAPDSSYLIKGGMLCRKDTSGNTIEVKIVTPGDEIEKIVNIVHTMSVAHTPPAKVVAFFLKHFTQVANLDMKVNEIVSNCSHCKLKSS